MKTINVADATNIQLDWLVAKIEGMLWLYEGDPTGDCPGNAYTTDWAQGGPIIEQMRERGIVWVESKEYGWQVSLLRRDKSRGINHFATGPTILLAAMRCFIANKLGDTVEVPEELT